MASESAPSKVPRDLEGEAVGMLPSQSNPTRTADTKQAVQQLMWGKVGILRDGYQLKEALRHLIHLGSHFNTVSANRAECELTNLITVAELMIVSAMAREESRGAHYRADHPCRNDEKLRKHSVISNASHVDFADFSKPRVPAKTPAAP